MNDFHKRTRFIWKLSFVIEYVLITCSAIFIAFVLYGLISDTSETSLIINVVYLIISLIWSHVIFTKSLPELYELREQTSKLLEKFEKEQDAKEEDLD